MEGKWMDDILTETIMKLRRTLRSSGGKITGEDAQVLSGKDIEPV
jgi:hypothetical protein